MVTLGVHAFPDALEREFSTEEKVALLHALYRVSGEGIVVMDDEGCIVVANEATGRMAGIPPEAMRGRYFLEFFPEDEMGVAIERFHDVMSGREVHDVITGVTASDERRRLEFSGYPITFREARAGLYIFKDITDRERASARMTALLKALTGALHADSRQEVCEALLDVLDDELRPLKAAIFIYDEDAKRLRLAAARPRDAIPATFEDRITSREGKGTFVTQAFERGCAVVSDDYLNAPVRDDVKRFVAAQGVRACAAVPLQGTSSQPEGVLVIGSSNPRAFDAREVEWLSLVAQEVALAISRRRAVEEAHASLALSKRMNDELEAFTYTASHDLSEPLRGIETLVSFVLEDRARMPREDVEILERVRTSALRLKRMIKALLDISRAMRASGEPEPVDLGEVLREAIADLRPLLDERGARVGVERTLPIVRAVPVRVRAVLTNLLNNAIRHNPKEGARAWVGARRLADGTHEVWVRDNGPGLSPELGERVFDLFVTGERQGGGAGAGLAIVRRLVEAEGGRVWLESPQEGGAKFVFRLPPRDGERAA